MKLNIVNGVLVFLLSRLCDHGLVIKRGSGLTIGAPDLNLWVKASSCNRTLSLQALEKRLDP
ncbi:hypothetical protein [Bartonella acomydis]|uniref:TraI-like middle domain-containing protein n=1 Tax=Bartonella acomydis TaxID=686234 RepID=A0ABP9MR81_9HYPH